MDKHSQKITRMIDKMTDAGWIARSVSREGGGLIEWSREGKAAMKILHHFMFDSLHLKPGDESVFAWMVSDFPDGLRRASKPPSKPPSS